MCGIAGFVLRAQTKGYEEFLSDGVSRLSRRGPDAQNVFFHQSTGLGHARLSIIDTSTSANQPFSDPSGRYTIVFNGEIFNYRELKQQYLKDVEFSTQSDTEVLLHLFIKKGTDCLSLLNGFFAFAIYDSYTATLWLARDRYGIKPLLIYEDEVSVLFASEMKALLRFPVKREIDFNTLQLYLQLNYIPMDKSMMKGFRKLMPGHWMQINGNGVIITEASYYDIVCSDGSTSSLSYEQAQKQLKSLVEQAVQRRLVSDVPLGAFLSGGIDSSIVVSQAAKYTKNLNTFSIGYKDEPFFDETKYAALVAKRYATNHTVFSISTDDMLQNIDDILDYIDEPFADSSAIAVYVLSKYTRQQVTVALSGDGGDELFAGYNKHQAEWRARQNSLVNVILSNGKPLLDFLPTSRHSKYTNFFRQLKRYAEGLEMSKESRYWKWCTFVSQLEALDTIHTRHHGIGSDESVVNNLSSIILSGNSMNSMLLADMKMVLPNDMLTKVDLMSMANSLEVRVPLLDYTVVDFAFSLPFEYKLRSGVGKAILKDAFRSDLPEELFNRPKRGFEVPLLKWFRTALKHKIEHSYLNDDFIAEQGIFDLRAVRKLKQQLHSSNPGDTHARIWALIVFQHWYKRYFANT